MSVLNLYKPIGISPLDLIESYKKAHPETKDQKMTYAGRLDPMADGVVLILSEEDRYKKDDFLKFDKTYRAQILFGIKSDTCDILGIPKILPKESGNTHQMLNIDKLEGRHLLKIPLYSSVIVNKKPLFQWARENKLDQISQPEREMNIYNAEIIKEDLIESNELLKLIKAKIKLVKGDFRQEEIINSWNESLNDKKLEFKIVTIDLNVASGTYIRSIANELGGLLFQLTRTTVGNYKIKDSEKI